MTRSIARRLSALTLAACAVTSACYSDDAAPKVPLAQAATTDSAKLVAEAHSLLGDKARAALDSGNVLFRKKHYAPALVLYRTAADLAPQHAAPLLGVYMVARATNNAAMADSALVEIKKRNGPLPSATHDLNAPALEELHQKVDMKTPTKATTKG